MKLLKLTCFFLFSTSAFAQTNDPVLAEGDFLSVNHNATVYGKAYVQKAPNGKDYVYLEDFRIRGGVVLDIKVCGDLDQFPNLCFSLGNPRRRGNQKWKIPTNLSVYKKVKIFDADLAYDLAEAEL